MQIKKQVEGEDDAVGVNERGEEDEGVGEGNMKQVATRGHCFLQNHRGTASYTWALLLTESTDESDPVAGLTTIVENKEGYTQCTGTPIITLLPTTNYTYSILFMYTYSKKKNSQPLLL